MPLFGPPDVAKLKAKKDVKGLVKALSYQKYATVRWQAANALAELRDPVTVEPLIAALADPDWEVRAAAAAALGMIRDPRALGPLLAALRDPVKGLRQAAAGSLGQIGDPRAVEALAVALRDPDAGVRAMAAGTLGQFGAGPWVEPLAAALADQDREVHQAALRSLGRIGDPRAVPGLIAIFKSGESWVDRDDAARALGAIGDPRAVDPLLTALRIHGSIVALALRRSAAEALVAIYRSGKLDETGKAKLLAQRGIIIQSHHDWVTGCVGNNEDEHTDTGIGADFPI